MLIGKTEINNKWIGAAGIILVALLVIVYLSIPSCSKSVTPTVVINQAQAAMETQFKAQLKDKDVQIADYKNKLVVSQGKYTALVQRYNALQKEKENVKAPVTNKELRDRFTALGYPPLAVK
jgi:hypothetical protein